MSRQLNKLKNLVSEIEQIQKNGRNKAPGAYRAPVFEEPKVQEQENTEENIVTAEAASQKSPADILREAAAPVRSRPKREPLIELPDEAAPAPAPVVALAPEKHMSNNHVSMELTGDIAVKLKLEESDEIIEVRRVGDHLAISFADGKSVHLPLKSVA